MSAFLKVEARASGSHAPASSGERRPLYVVAKDRVQIRANQDFLVVEAAGHSARHFAFARLDRIVCHAGVDWSGEAMTRCLQHRITISWLNGWVSESYTG